MRTEQELLEYALQDMCNIPLNRRPAWMPLVLDLVSREATVREDQPPAESKVVDFLTRLGAVGASNGDRYAAAHFQIDLGQALEEVMPIWAVLDGSIIIKPEDADRIVGHLPHSNLPREAYVEMLASACLNWLRRFYEDR